MNPIEKLTAPDLVHLFGLYFDGHINKGRDSHMLRLAMDMYDISPPQILLGMFVYTDLGGNRDIPSFLRSQNRWLVEDKLEAEAELCRRCTGTISGDLMVYLDLRDGPMPDAHCNQVFELAKQNLEAEVAGFLSETFGPKYHRGGSGWLPKQRRQPSRTTTGGPIG